MSSVWSRDLRKTSLSSKGSHVHIYILKWQKHMVRVKKAYKKTIFNLIFACLRKNHNYIDLQIVSLIWKYVWEHIYNFTMLGKKTNFTGKKLVQCFLTSTFPNYRPAIAKSVEIWNRSVWNTFGFDSYLPSTTITHMFFSVDRGSIGMEICS